MLKQLALRTAAVLTLALLAFTLPACQTTEKSGAQALTGDTEVMHERHATGIDSQTAD